MDTFALEVGSKKLTLSLTNWAMQSSGSVLAQYGDTVVLATVTQGENPRSGIDYFPLMVDYDERFYAGGKIGGSRFVRREGKPSDQAILTARMIDRSLRPLFNDAERRDIQVVITVLSFDKENDPDVLSLVAASAALTISPIAFNGPVGAIRLGRMDGKLVLNPTYQERAQSDFDIILAGIGDLVIMVEAGGREVPEADVKAAWKEGVKFVKQLTEFQEQIAKKVGNKKYEIKPAESNPSLAEFVRHFANKRLSESLFKKSDIAVKESLGQLKGELGQEIIKEFGGDAWSSAQALFYGELETLLKTKGVKENIRPDGRKSEELRSLSCQVGVLPRTHGSALFMRGMTHALSVLTLGAPGDERLIDSMETEEKQRFMHHYNFPPFSVGEVAPLRGPSRRDLGHGYLAQRALEPVIPSIQDFPYTVRIVTEILSSNGSSSMASACGSSLALMDAGVPILAPVAGIAMGLLYESPEEFTILTDIQGPEDQNGEMDCKVAGTAKGITAIQMDTKLAGIPLAVLDKTLDQAREARLQILDEMNKVIEKPREALSPFAPRVIKLTIDPAKIRFVIGPGGETINNIIAETGAKIDIEDDGTIFITAPDVDAGLKAKEIIEQITRDFKEGDVVEGKISGIKEFGAFVQLAPGKEGLVHISELADRYVKDVSEVVSLGQIVEVRIIGIDREGKIRLSLKKRANRLEEGQARRLSGGSNNHHGHTPKGRSHKS